MLILVMYSVVVVKVDVVTVYTVIMNVYANKWEWLKGGGDLWLPSPH